jgi:hypothetical protein
MGFNIGRTITLEWEEGTDLAGAVIVMRPTPIKVVLDIEDSDSLRQSLEAFIAHVREWNLEDDDGPIPVTVEDAIGRLERPMAMEFIKQWYRAALGLSAPLALTSGDGQPSPDTESEAPSMPMELLSRLPVNSSVPAGS